MNPQLAIPALVLTSATCGFGALSLEINIGALHSSTAAVVSDSSLWAVVIDQNGDGILPSNLTDGSSLTVAQASVVSAAFSGKSITAGTPIGSDMISYVFPVDGVLTTGTAGLSVKTISLDDAAWQAVAGKQWAIYWFPGLSSGSATLPTTGDFEVGGIRQNAAGGSGGTVGMTIPAYVANTSPALTAAFVDNADNGGDLSVARLSSIKVTAIPETSTLTLAALGLGAVLRRRRN